MAKSDDKKYRVRLIKSHEDDGIMYPEGRLLTVDESTYNSMVSLEVVEAPEKPNATSKIDGEK